MPKYNLTNFRVKWEDPSGPSQRHSAKLVADYTPTAEQGGGPLREVVLCWFQYWIMGCCGCWSMSNFQSWVEDWTPVLKLLEDMKTSYGDFIEYPSVFYNAREVLFILNDGQREMHPTLTNNPKVTLRDHWISKSEPGHNIWLYRWSVDNDFHSPDEVQNAHK